MNPQPRMTGSLWWLAGLGLYVALGLLVLGYHEMWRDEFQAWLIAKESRSLGELWQNTRYEGHPLLWFLTLYGLTRITVQPEAMQILHFTVAVASVTLLWRYGPFPSAYKALISFGYFFFYEYAIISRNYAQGVLLVLLFLAAYRPSPDKPYLLLALILALLCQTNIYGLLLAVNFGAFLAEELWRGGPLGAFRQNSRWFLALSTLVFLLGVVVGLYTVIPPSDFSPPGGGGLWVTGFDPSHLKRTLAHLFRSYFPLPALQYRFWETNLLNIKSIQVGLGLCLFFFFLWSFGKNPPIARLYGGGSTTLLTFMYVIYTVSLRHAGHLYLLLLACLWLAAVHPEKSLKTPGWDNLCGWCARHRPRLLLLVLVIQVLAAGVASFYDWRHPFSASRAAAAFIKKNGLEDRFLVGDMDAPVSPVAAYLNRQIYYLTKRDWGSFIVWNNGRKKVNPVELAQTLKDLARRHNQRLLLILNYPAPPEISFLNLKAAFTESIRWDESYYLYEMETGEKLGEREGPGS
uniref:Glycosyltransferase RgtA/B/C/D-like domain-containing protein n=1 Tax=Desulfobacca acetoxidans TaxID=60893 RepID=A0A7C5AMQ7_9BACT